MDHLVKLRFFGFAAISVAFRQPVFLKRKDLENVKLLHHVSR